MNRASIKTQGDSVGPTSASQASRYQLRICEGRPATRTDVVASNGVVKGR